MSKRRTKVGAIRSVEELKRASLVVHHEVANMFSTYLLLQEYGADPNSNPTGKERAINNALICAFLIQARGLIGFLYSHDLRQSDIVGEDFFPDDPDFWKKNRAVPDPDLANGQLIRQISKQLAHLTWDRADTTKPLWGPFKIAWNIGLVLESFVQQVNDANIHVQLREDIAISMMGLRAEWENSGIDADEMAPFQEFIESDLFDYFDGNPGHGDE